MNVNLKSRKAVVLGLIIALAAGVGAYAYWTTGGSGSGDAAAGDVQNLVVKQTTNLTAMYPGDTAQTISGTFDNPNNGPTYVGAVTVEIDTVTKAGGAVAGDCDASDFTLTDKKMTVNAEVPKGNAQGNWTGAKIKFNNKASNQDACKGAAVKLKYTISAS